MSKLSSIRAELDSNVPLYGGMTDQQVADELNALDKTTVRSTVSGSEIFNATDDTEYAALTEAQKSAWDALCAIDTINTSSGVAKAREAELFGPGTATRTSLLALKNQTQSRAQQIGVGTVDAGDIKHARAL